MIQSLSPAGSILLLIFLIGLILLIRALWEIRQLSISRIKLSPDTKHRGTDSSLKNENACQTKRAWQAISLPAYRMRRHHQRRKISSKNAISPYEQSTQTTEVKNNSKAGQHTKTSQFVAQTTYIGKQSEAKRFRVMQLSDIHADHLYIPFKKIMQAVVSENPDLLVFTGDLTGRDKNLSKGLAFLEKFCREARQLHIPVVAVAGNHDTPETIQGMRALGIQVLENESMLVDSAAGPVKIIGLEDLRNGFPDYVTAINQCTVSESEVPARQAKTDSFRLVLAHNPDTIFYLPEQAADLLLAGHFHGGQIWMPFQFEFIMLREEKLPKMSITRGLNIVREMPLYISRGLGCVSIPLRLFSIPELAVFDIIGED